MELSLFLIRTPRVSYCNHCVRLFVKSLTLAITFLSKKIGLSYLACVFFMTRPFNGTIKFEHVTLTVTFDGPKKLTLPPRGPS